MTFPNHTRRILAAAALCAAGTASAQYTVQLGGLYLDPGAKASATTGPLTPANALSLDVKPTSTVFFSVARDITPDWELELALGYPPTHDITLRVLNPAALPPSVASQNGNRIGTVRQTAPTLLANYRFGQPDGLWRPYLGIGINYTMFDNASANGLDQSINGGPTNGRLSDSWGLAAQAGVVYKLGGPWTLNAAVLTAGVKTTLTTNTLGVLRTTDVTFSPTVYVLSVGYKF